MDCPIRGRGKNKRFWTSQEDETLLQSLLELSHDPKWKGENGFKPGYMNRLEDMISTKHPNSGLKAEPNIESRLKHWTEKYCAMAEMLGISGFNWDDEKKLLQVERSVYDEWIKTHKKAKGLYGVPFPYYDMLAEIYGKDKATGQASESFVQAAQNIELDLTRQGSTTIDSDDDIDLEEELEIESMQSGSGSRKRKSASSGKSVKKPKTSTKRMDNAGDLAASLQSATMEFGKFFQDMNANLSTMAQAWTSEEERRKKLDNDTNNVLEEVLKLELSSSEALEVCSILMAEEPKLRLFFQASTSLKKQFVRDLLRKKS